MREINQFFPKPVPILEICIKQNRMYAFGSPLNAIFEFFRILKLEQEFLSIFNIWILNSKFASMVISRSSHFNGTTS